MDVTEFLLARIAEDEATARGAINGGGDAGPWLVGADTAPHLSPTTVFRPSDWRGHIVHACDTELAENPLDVARHIARWDPARVLAECAAKRRLLRDEPCADWSYGQPCDHVRAVAAVYADHPDYDPAWALEGAAAQN
jgi:hypothetical protein